MKMLISTAWQGITLVIVPMKMLNYLAWQGINLVIVPMKMHLSLAWQGTTLVVEPMYILLSMTWQGTKHMVEPMNMSTFLSITLGLLVSINGTVLSQNGSLISIQWYQRNESKCFKKIQEKTCFMQTQPNSTQPDIHVDVVFVTYIDHSVICHYINCTDPLWLHIQICRTIYCRVRIRFRISSLQLTCLCLWHMIEDEAH